ncbi:YlbL family protein [Demequina globuliformis]|uniref:YlbL family protein n=1 Tax=Demequina globuliformis TaxID=676202 RepID=UPI0009FEA733|nr:PDZ domain-containing protein [Demequina globuliformis]
MPLTETDTVPADPHEIGAHRYTVMSIAGLVAAALMAVLSVLPAQFAIGGPGPTYDTLGETEDGTPLVQIDGAPTYPASGELRLTTVSVARSSSELFTLGPVLRGWLSPERYVQPEENVFGDPEQEEEFDEQSQVEWVTSQEAATVAALEVLGEPVPATLEVAGLDGSSQADGLILAGDIITSVDGAAVDTFGELTDAVTAHAPGDDITVGFTRDGQAQEATFGLNDNGSGGAVMGLYIDPQFDLPIDVTVQIDKVGGPSAGMMFSLGILDKLTETDELNGAHVAGTGALSADGDVHPIGGIRMKLYGALNAGADYFLAPIENCDEVIDHVPEGLEVFAVDNVDQAYDAIQAIGAGDTAALATCAAP